MYARKGLIYLFALIATASVTAFAALPLQQASPGTARATRSIGAAATSQPALRVTGIAATPKTLAPIDVLTVSTSVANDASRVDGLTVQMVVFDETGEPVLQEKQSNIGIAQNGKQAVYWVWRIPDRLADGTYAIQMTVLSGGEREVASDTRDAAFRVDRSLSDRYSARR
ncbi:MAG: hypothetical protein HYY30_05770 [Chloroflexi bacterium]|nr:hypothetical protein [Chloroflexota bacterium]